MKRIVVILLYLLTVVTASAISIDKIPNVHLADRTRYTSDPSGYLSAAALARADSITAAMWNATTAEPVAVIVDNLDGLDIDYAATELFEKWGLGKSDKDNGVLLLFSVGDRKAAIRTGYGVEGVLPDVYCARIIRNLIAPAFADERYDDGVTSSLEAVSAIITQPDAAEELMSQFENDANARREEPDFFGSYIVLAVIALAIMLALLIYRLVKTRGMERHERYEQLRSLSLPYLVVSIAGLGIPLVAYALLRLVMHRVRRSVPDCPDCQHKMRLIDEVHDNDYLTPAQDREEQLNSVDYDVWHCDNCQKNLILPYVNHQAGYSVCPNCGSRADVLESNTVVQQPTTSADGVGQKTYYCRNCNKRRKQLYKIAKVAAPPVVIMGPGLRGGRGGGFGGGFGGGGFGGGHTGGGGASGGW